MIFLIIGYGVACGLELDANKGIARTKGYNRLDMLNIVDSKLYSKQTKPPGMVNQYQSRSLRDCAKLLQQLGPEVAILELKHLQAFWLSIMADKSAPHRDRLHASKLYADSIGAFNTDTNDTARGAKITWKTAVTEAEIVQNESN